MESGRTFNSKISLFFASNSFFTGSTLSSAFFSASSFFASGSELYHLAAAGRDILINDVGV